MEILTKLWLKVVPSFWQACSRNILIEPGETLQGPVIFFGHAEEGNGSIYFGRPLSFEYVEKGN